MLKRPLAVNHLLMLFHDEMYRMLQAQAYICMSKEKRKVYRSFCLVPTCRPWKKENLVIQLQPGPPCEVSRNMCLKSHFHVHIHAILVSRNFLAKIILVVTSLFIFLTKTFDRCLFWDESATSKSSYKTGYD